MSNCAVMSSPTNAFRGFFRFFFTYIQSLNCLKKKKQTEYIIQMLYKNNDTMLYKIP